MAADDIALLASGPYYIAHAIRPKAFHSIVLLMVLLLCWRQHHALMMRGRSSVSIIRVDLIDAVTG